MTIVSGVFCWVRRAGVLQVYLYLCSIKSHSGIWITRIFLLAKVQFLEVCILSNITSTFTLEAMSLLVMSDIDLYVLSDTRIQTYVNKTTIQTQPQICAINTSHIKIQKHLDQKKNRQKCIGLGWEGQCVRRLSAVLDQSWASALGWYWGNTVPTL